MKNKYAFLDLLLLAEVDDKLISDEAVREEVDTFMFEVTIVIIINLIVTNSGVQRKLTGLVATSTRGRTSNEVGDTNAVYHHGRAIADCPVVDSGCCVRITAHSSNIHCQIRNSNL